MFAQLFFQLRAADVPVTPTAFLRLHQALRRGLVASLDDLYTAARCILVKSEKDFDRYDQVFAHCFAGAALPDFEGDALLEAARALLEAWLDDPEALGQALGLSPEQVRAMSPQELERLFLERLQEQTEAHSGGSHWIGTRGRSPFGHSGVHPGGMRVGGISRNRSAIKVAMDRRYRDYARGGPLTRAQLGEALRRLRHMTPAGPKDRLDVAASIAQTVKRGGEIELVFAQGLRDRLKVILAIDNGGWSMTPFVPLVQTLFDHARAQLKELRVLYFHNTLYNCAWEDASRWHKPVRVDHLAREDRATRLVIVGDASMAPYELLSDDGSIHFGDRSGRPSIEWLRLLARSFPHAVWLNPVPLRYWRHTETIALIREIVPMFELSLEGLEQAVAQLARKH